jgi:phage tail protein X
MAKLIKTVRGDTFDALALEMLGDEKFAGTIMQYNPDYCDTLIFDAGVELYIPDSVNVVPPETMPPWRR